MLDYYLRKINTNKRLKQQQQFIKMNQLYKDNLCLWHKSPSISKESSCYQHCHINCDGKPEHCNTENYISLKDIPKHIAEQYTNNK